MVSFGRGHQYAPRGESDRRLGTIVEWTPCRLSGPAFADLLDTGGLYELVVESGPSPLVVEGDDLPDALAGPSMEQAPDPGCRGGGRGHRSGGATPEWADLVVGPDAPTLGAVLATVADSPLASTTLAVLLRTGQNRSVAEGLVAESTAYGLLQGGPEFARWRAGHPAPVRPEPAGDPVRVSRRDHVLTITLDRPHVRNAFDAAIRDHLVAALEVAATDPSVTTVVLRGAGRSFCSGGDLDEFGSRPDPVTAHLVRLQRNAGRAMAEVADRTTVHIHGWTVRLGYRAGCVRPSGGGPGRHPHRPSRGATRPRPGRRRNGQPARADRTPRHHAAGRRSPVDRRRHGAGVGPGRRDRGLSAGLAAAGPCGFGNHRVMI